MRPVSAHTNAGHAGAAPAFVPLPKVTVGTGSVMLGADFTITVTFRNDGDETGYGPFFDLYIPHVGLDGLYPDEAGYDGIRPATGVNYNASLGSEPLLVVTRSFPDDGAGSGCVKHPWALDESGYFLDVCGRAGDQLVSVQIPYGSYTPGQPALTIRIPAHLSENANLGSALTIRARAGFIFGRTPMVDWCCTSPVDTTIVSDAGSPDTWVPFSDVIPTLVTFSKSTNAGELATGPNNPATYTLRVNTADGQTFSNIDITDPLPDSIVYLANLTANPPATFVSEPPLGGPYTDEQLLLHWDGPVSSDITVTFDYYVPDLDANGQPVAPGSTTNTATLDAITWIPSDGSLPVEVSAGVGPGVASHTDRPLTLGKSSSLAVDPASNGTTPGDIVRYTLTFDISDYYGYAGLSLEDILSDGQHYYQDASYFPQLIIGRDGSTETYPFSTENVDVNCNYTETSFGGECDSHDFDNSSLPDNNGQTTVTFDIAQELIDRLGSDIVLGDLVDDGGGAANATTTGTVTFFALVQDAYTDTYPGESLKMGDALGDSASISGYQVDPATCNPGPCTITATVSNESASASISVGRGTLEKTIVARNGLVCHPATFDPCDSVQVSAGDAITYRISYDLLTGDFAELRLTDFLPLPIFHADDPSVDGSSLATWPAYAGAAAIPDPGTWMLGPGDTRGFDPIAVIVSDHLQDNSVQFEFGSYDDPLNSPKTIELLFTVRVTNEKFGDGLQMRNSVLQQDANSPGSVTTTSNYIDLTLTEPLLVGEKTVVSTDRDGIDPDPVIPPPVVFNDPGDPLSPPWDIASPINSDYLDANPLGSGISGIDGGDLVKFAIVIENTGSGINGAFDITLKDVMPGGYVFPGVGLGGFNLQAYRGDGKALDDGSGTGFEFLGPNGDATDFFGDGLRLKDPAQNPAFTPSDPEYGQGLCQMHEAASGKNVIIVTYDLMVDPDIAPGALLENEGQVTSYSGSEGGDPYIPGPITDTSETEIGNPGLLKELVGTEFDHAANNRTQVVIGELLTYRLTVTLPEGLSPNAQVVDTLDPELAFVHQVSFDNSNPGEVLIAGSTTPAITNNGQTITWDLGTIENNNSDNTIPETLTFEYTAVVLNTNSNQSGSTRDNSVSMTWDTLDADGNTVAVSQGPVSAETVTIIEPLLNLTKVASPPSGDAGDPLTYTLTLTHDPASQTDAYDVTLNDPLPLCAAGGASAIANPVIFSVTDSAGLLTTANFELSGDNATGWTLRTPAGSSFDLPYDAGRSIQTVISGTVAYCVRPTQSFTNTANLYWTSLDGPVADRSTFHTSSDERTGADGVGSGLNNYADSAAAAFTVTSTTPVKYLRVTSEAHTAEPVSPFQPAAGSPVPVTVGEIIRYRLVVALPEGSSPNFAMLDYLPNGITFLNDGTAKAAFVSNNPIVSTAHVVSGSFTIPAVADSNCRLPNSAVAGDSPLIPAACPALGDLNVSVTSASNNDAYSTGTDVYFLLGALQNSDNDPDNEYVIVEFNGLIDNNGAPATSNDTGESHGNRYRVYINGALITGYSNYVYTRVVEPAITDLSKSVNPPNGDAGDPITYTVTFSNAGSALAATAFDVVLSDTIHSNMTADLGAMAVNSACATGLDTSRSSGNNLDVRFASVPVGCSVELTYTASLNDGVPTGQLLENTVELTYSSLSGDYGTSSNPTGSSLAGAPGAASGERDGKGANPPNDYSDTASASVTTMLAEISKQLETTSASHTAGSNVTIGEVVTYGILLTFPEGTTPSDLVTDDLPAGLAVIEGTPEVITSAAQSAGLLAADFNGTIGAQTIDVIAGDGGSLSFELSDVNLPSDNNLANNTLLLRFSALVTDVAGNAGFPAATTLSNTASNQTGAGMPTPSNTVEITVVEPRPVISKSFTNLTDGSAGKSGTLNDVIRVTLAYQNAGTSNAFDVIITDVLDDTRFSDLTEVTTPAGWNFSTSGSHPVTVQYAAEAGTAVVPGETVLFEFDVTLTSDNAPGDVMTNTASVTQATSLDRSAEDGEDANERNATASGYDTLTFNALDLSLTKDDGEVTVQPGDVLSYLLVIQNAGDMDGTNVTLTETVPANTSYASADNLYPWDCGGTDPAPAGSVCTLNVGTLAAGSGGSVTFAVRVDDPLPSGTDVLSNVASVSADQPEIITGNNSASEDTPVSAGPALTVTKDDQLSIVAPGAQLTYTITVQNHGNQDASGLVLTDTLPSVLKYVSSSDSGSETNGIVTWPLFDLASGASTSRTVTVRLKAVEDLGGATGFTNLVHVQDDGSNTDGEPVTAEADDTDQIAYLDSKTILRTNINNDTATKVLIGEILTYQISLTIPPGTLGNLKALDELDEGLSFDECLSASVSDLGAVTTTLAGGFAEACPAAHGDPDVSNAGRKVVFDFGTVTNASATDQTLTVQYLVDVLDSASNENGLGGIDNKVSWTWDGGSLQASAPPVDIVEPDVSILKDASPKVALLGSTITFSLKIAHSDLSTADAYDVVVTDQLPPGLGYLGNVTVKGLAYDRFNFDTASSTVTFEWDVFPLLATSKVTFEASFLGPPSVVNEASVAWTSIPLDPGVQSSYNEESTERFYDPLDPEGVNDYGNSSSVTINRPRLPKTGFAPGKVTLLPAQPKEGEYKKLDALSLEIPRLSVKLSIVGVPASAQGWDLTWLTDQAGWLEGTAYPTLAGNTGITAHTYLADGRPGPFVNLGSLYWGDQVYILANGNRYIYEVREVRLLWPDDTSVLRHEEYDWITLITCREYNEKTGDYNYRVAVRAVLVKVEPE